MIGVVVMVIFFTLTGTAKSGTVYEQCYKSP
jgi:hypothetical protein